MKKRHLWYFTLLSIIFVLCIYYVTIPNDLLATIPDNDSDSEVVSTIKEANSLVALRVNLQEERQEQMEVLQKEMTSNKSNQEKNNAYEKLKYLNEVQSREEDSELKIKDKLGLDCFVKIENNNINCVCISDNHNESLANQVMRLLQENYDNRQNITVKFQKS